MKQWDKQNLIKLGKRIKKLRKEKSPSLNLLVFKKGGVTSATWSRIENGKVDLKFSTLVKIAAILDIEICQLLSGIVFDYAINEDGEE